MAEVVKKDLSERLLTAFRSLENNFQGDLKIDYATRLMYATDASAYRELPLAVCYPADEKDIISLVNFAIENKITLIPRAAGTSLAGQVVGNGLIVDISRNMTSILEFNSEKATVKVQPGVILDELNKKIKYSGLFFSPETSTSNRCMIGGMIGNNSSGLHSVVYGTTREHLYSVRIVLSDASVAEFRPLTKIEFHEKCELNTLEGKLYRQIRDILSNADIRNEIFNQFPDPEVVRRNTGYALDEMAATAFFSQGNHKKHEKFNFARLIAGSEGTLGFITEATLMLDPLPPKQKALIPVHVNSVMEAIKGNLLALKHHPSAVELMDKTILDLTKGNITQNKNRFFVEGDPGAILIVEFTAETIDELEEKANSMISSFKKEGIGFHFPLISGNDIPRVWALRKAGLGVLSKMKGDAKPVSVIEDTSVKPSSLEEYIKQFDELLDKYNLDCVYHAHISVGELHLRPVLNLKDPGDVELFHTIAEETAKLVKKFRGSLSGEHGDGRLRGEFIPIMVGEKIYNLFREIKNTWDPNGVFNKNKIIDSPPMNTFLRYSPRQESIEPETIFNFTGEGGMLRHIEQCNGSGDCRKTEITGGTMCPSYMASREEFATTRARANILREYIGKKGKKGIFDHQEVYDILDLCLSCKACKSECPSSVDMAKLKAEFLQHWYDIHGIPLRTRVIGYITSFNKMGSAFPGLFNFFVRNKFLSGILKSILGFAPDRSIPEISSTTVYAWSKKHLKQLNMKLPANAREVTYFLDEFTNFNDAHIGIATIKLLHALGIKVFVFQASISARSFMSKGLLKTARKHAIRNVIFFKDLVHENRPLIGTEPSAILSFRDEYPELVGESLIYEAKELSNHAFLIEEYIADLIDLNMINNQLFTKNSRQIKLHGHCQQKAIAGTKETIQMLSLPENYHVTEIPSGCCGMAGSFGYEKEHFVLSMKVGELVLFPEIRNADKETIIAAPGTSCRHQIKDGTKNHSLHPVEILYDALIDKNPF